MRINARKQSNEDILEKVKEYKSLKELRDDSFGLYQLIRRRELLQKVIDFFPLHKYSKKVYKLKDPKDKLKPGPKPKKEKEIKMLRIYNHTFKDGVKVCGRCFINETKTRQSLLCNDCQRVYARQYAYEKDHVPYNLKQEYCNTIIKHHEKTFELGIRVDERVERYLRMVGYDFIFQEPWDDIWK
jgi:hypothetical protein